MYDMYHLLTVILKWNICLYIGWHCTSTWWCGSDDILYQSVGSAWWSAGTESVCFATFSHPFIPQELWQGTPRFNVSYLLQLVVAFYMMWEWSGCRFLMHSWMNNIAEFLYFWLDIKQNMVICFHSFKNGLLICTECSCQWWQTEAVDRPQSADS